MINNRTLRAMWLLNHTEARKFELAMLKENGIKEIFLPKKYPQDPNFRSASVDYSEDAHLTIPKESLDILNRADWYGDPGIEAWEIANKFFDVLFFILYTPEFIDNLTKHYRGIAIWRAYGLSSDNSYANILALLCGREGQRYIKRLGRRFFFGNAYAHIHLNEPDFLKDRSLYLPLGLYNCDITDQWIGSARKIFFICPDIGFNNYYKAIYQQFKASFGDLPHVIGGSQAIPVGDSNVLGFVPQDVHEQNMRELRVMFYHSTEPNHIHYHPFEAIRAGMPLVFMAGSMLDRLGGETLPGRSKSFADARNKIERILNDDWNLIKDIRLSQPRLLAAMKRETCMEAWREGIHRIRKSLNVPQHNSHAVHKRRVAVIIPAGYRGGSLRGAKLLAQAIEIGSRQAGEMAEVVLGHLDDPNLYPSAEFADLPASIKRRPFKWRYVDADEARRAMVYSGLDNSLNYNIYQVPDDRIKQFFDCDLWVFISDRLEHPVLPIRPYIVMVYDYLQRYFDILSPEINKRFIANTQAAARIWVTTEFTGRDAVQFAGVPLRKVLKVPMLIPALKRCSELIKPHDLNKYFLWTSNLGIRKNHENAIKALRIYYEALDGQLDCHITGVNTEHIFNSSLPHLQGLMRIIDSSSALKERLRVFGELPDESYQMELANAEFLWHPALIDNGTFTVLEAAYLRVPALSSDYPAMHEINDMYDLNITWMDPYNPYCMAQQLKYMERQAQKLRKLLPPYEMLELHSLEKLGSAYWKAVKQCL